MKKDVIANVFLPSVIIGQLIPPAFADIIAAK
jgi:hypothetical protein